MTEEEKQALRVPAWCPTCDIFMKNSKTYFKWGCCGDCFIEFIEHREERWQGGWRPSPEEVAGFLKKMNC